VSTLRHLILALVVLVVAPSSGGQYPPPRTCVVPCTHPMHPYDVIPCQHVCYGPYGAYPCHPAGDAVPCMHPMHPYGDVIYC